MNNNRYWVWLSLALGFDNWRIKSIYKAYEDVSMFYNGKEFEWMFCDIFTPNEIEKLKSTPISAADEIIDKCDELNYRIIAIDNKDYPQCLREIDTPPAVLYVSGYLPKLDNLVTIGVVGTRHATNYGRKVAYSISYNLSKSKAVIISGGAMGIDSYAHNGALNADGVTIAVLGCGINYPYLTKFAPMRKAISVSGCVISEYPPDTEPLAYHFPMRNRIIAALSKGILVVEAARKSGSLITAQLAGEYGKDVFAVMGNINSTYSVGSNELIKDGAIPVTTYTDIIGYYNQNFDIEITEDDEFEIPQGEVLKIPAKETGRKPDKDFKTGHRYDVELDDNSRNVYMNVTSTPIHIDEIILKSGLPPYKIISILTKLEMQNLIVSSPGKQYKLK